MLERKLIAGLSFTGGFVDTATFVAVAEIFSSHVTGNFILFASKIVTEIEPDDYLKLLVFPVFVFSVIIATLVYDRMIAKNIGKPERKLLFVVAIILFLGGSTSSLIFANHKGLLAMVVVFAMGFQNTFHSLNKSAGPMTTVMTGNTSTLAIELTRLFWRKGSEHKEKVVNALVVFFSFLIGCIAAAFSTYHFGLVSLLIPSVVLSFFLFVTRK